MKRKIIAIDEERCDGCEACAEACHEGAIRMVNGKARLIRDDYCDGLGDCLPACPAGAIRFVEREAAPYNAEAVAAEKAGAQAPLACGCPGTMAKSIRHEEAEACGQDCGCRGEPVSRLSQWPVQIRLVPARAPYFDGARLLVAADCTAYAYANLHEAFIRGHITLVGCPKLDSVDYSEKLTDILRDNAIRSVDVVRMEVPCCGGLELAVKTALKSSGKEIPCRVVTVSTDGRIIGNTQEL
ncbi:MAG: 4Fe-4S binding protein [Clostridia bacterium]|nr:4Fe-4S binding protein [Clostridia bacterium]